MKNTYIAHFAYSGKGQGTGLFFAEEVDYEVGVHVVLVAGDRLGHQHLDDPDHAAPADVLGLAKPAIAEPDDLLEVIKELFPLTGVVVLAEESDFLLAVLEVEGHSGAEGQLEDAVVLEVVGQVRTKLPQ